MEKIHCICVMRDLFAALSELEEGLFAAYGISLKEAMVLCAVAGETVVAGVISERTGMTPSNTSKIIASLEKKDMLIRRLCDNDKRQMCFTLTRKAEECLQAIRCNGVEIPELLQSFFTV